MGLIQPALNSVGDIPSPGTGASVLVTSAVMSCSAPGFQSMKTYFTSLPTPAALSGDTAPA